MYFNCRNAYFTSDTKNDDLKCFILNILKLEYCNLIRIDILIKQKIRQQKKHTKL